MIVADARGRYQFRHALLREVVHDDLLPGEHAELHLALARALEAQAAETGEDAIITAGIAHHYLSAGCQREALAPSVRAADAAERVHAHGEAGALLERALDLWSRVPDAMEQAGCERNELVRRAAPGADQRRRPRPRRGAAQARARPRSTSSSSRGWRPGCWSCSRARSGRSAAPRSARGAIARGVELLPEDEAQSPERARIFSRPGQDRDVQGRFSEVLPAAPRGARAPPPRRDAGPRADALNAMGVSLVLLGEVEEGSAAPARGDRDLARSASSAPARGPTWPTRCTWSGARARRYAVGASRAWPTPPAPAARATG